ncbi:MAG TPA: ATP-binding cassette domain-containing protein, partial [Burkholderiales bacterium]
MLLKVERLELAYGEVPAVREVSFEVAEGEIVTLIGANGAGKSTTMRGVAGAMLPRRGRILFDGKDVTRLPAHARAAAGIALVPEGRRVFPALTVRENLEMGGFKYRRDRSKVEALIERAMHSFPRLRERAAQPAGTLSGGEQQMLALSRALMSEPRLL